jgi:hypothetical protein
MAGRDNGPVIFINIHQFAGIPGRALIFAAGLRRIAPKLTIIQIIAVMAIMGFPVPIFFLVPGTFLIGGARIIPAFTLFTSYARGIFRASHRIFKTLKAWQGKSGCRFSVLGKDLDLFALAAPTIRHARDPPRCPPSQGFTGRRRRGQHTFKTTHHFDRIDGRHIRARKNTLARAIPFASR